MTVLVGFGKGIKFQDGPVGGAAYYARKRRRLRSNAHAAAFTVKGTKFGVSMRVTLTVQ